jgi:hypothetical protein
VPGRLAALCAGLGLNGHGITAPPARELPEPWFSLLAHYLRRKPDTVPVHDDSATARLPFCPNWTASGWSCSACTTAALVSPAVKILLSDTAHGLRCASGQLSGGGRESNPPTTQRAVHRF